MTTALDELRDVLPGDLEGTQPTGETLHVLIVDDEESIRRLCRLYLEHADESLAVHAPEIHVAESGEQAIAKLQELTERGERLAAVMVDMVFPKAPDGIETIERLWAIDPDIQVTLMTGEGHLVEQRIQGRIPGELLDRWDYLAKPFTEFQFAQRVRRALTAWISHSKEGQRRRENMQLLMQLAANNRELEETVRDRTRDLAHRAAEQEKKNTELEAALRELEAAQSRLLQTEKMASIGQLAAGVAHELNNPIGFVHSNLGTLQRYVEKINTLTDAYEQRVDPADEELSALKKELKIEFVLDDLPALVDESLEGTERVRKIVMDLKGFSHPTENEARFADINEGLRSTLNIVHNEIKYKAEVTADYGEIPEVHCMPGQINQVLMNLLVNAAQAIDESGHIHLRTWCEDEYVYVSVRDDGCGVPPDALSRIFDPFFTTKEVGQGTGLGLSLSYDIVRNHNGDFTVESEPGAGTCFTVRLPVNGCHESE